MPQFNLKSYHLYCPQIHGYGNRANLLRDQSLPPKLLLRIRDPKGNKNNNLTKLQPNTEVNICYCIYKQKQIKCKLLTKLCSDTFEIKLT